MVGGGYSAGGRIADVGCGPGAILRLLAERIGTEGRAVGVDADPSAVSIARQQTAGLPQVRVQVGQADATGLDPSAYNVVMCRHVLAHNGGRETAIVVHLASLAATGGCVYLVDVDATALRITPSEPELQDLQERYWEFHRARGNDLSVGLRLGDLLTDAGLTVERYACRAPVLRVPPGMRPPSWAARNDMVAEGFATDADIKRWEDAFARLAFGQASTLAVPSELRCDRPTRVANRCPLPPSRGKAVDSGGSRLWLLGLRLAFQKGHLAGEI